MNDGPGKSFMKNLDCAEGYQNDGSTESEQAEKLHPGPGPNSAVRALHEAGTV
jgi:hypothetical protein